MQGITAHTPHTSLGMIPPPRPRARIILIILITRTNSHRRLRLRFFVIPYNIEPTQFDNIKRFDCEILNLIVD